MAGGEPPLGTVLGVVRERRLYQLVQDPAVQVLEKEGGLASNRVFSNRAGKPGRDGPPAM